MISNVLDLQYDLGGKGQGEIYIKAGRFEYNTNSFHIIGRMIFIFDTMFVQSVKMTRKLLDSS